MAGGANFAAAMAPAGIDPLAGGGRAVRCCARSPIFTGTASRRHSFSHYPAILVTAVLLGWKEAVFVLVLSLSAGWYFFLPPGMTLLPAGWAFVGALNIAISIALKALAEQLAEANERQRLLFEELQHRVANRLQATVGKLERVRRTMASRPSEAADMLDEAIGRMPVSAELHRHLRDPAVFNNGLE